MIGGKAHHLLSFVQAGRAHSRPASRYHASVAAKKPAAKKLKGNRKPPPNTTIRTPENRKIIFAGVESGMPPSAAFKLARIAESSFYLWLKEDETFRDAIEHAKAKAVENKIAAMNTIIAQQARGGPSLITFWLERMVPEFKPRSEVTMGMTEEDRRRVEYLRKLEEMSDAELAKAAGDRDAGGEIHAHRSRARAAPTKGERVPS